MGLSGIFNNRADPTVAPLLERVEMLKDNVLNAAGEFSRPAEDFKTEKDLSGIYTAEEEEIVSAALRQAHRTEWQARFSIGLTAYQRASDNYVATAQKESAERQISFETSEAGFSAEQTDYLRVAVARMKEAGFEFNEQQTTVLEKLGLNKDNNGQAQDYDR